MRALWRAIGSTLFWPYERGTWPYDVLVIAIVAFVFLSPRNWFSDQPQLGPLTETAQVQLVEDEASSATRTYRVSAHLLSIPMRTPELEKETHEVLRKNVPELHKRTFRIERIEPVRDEDGTITSYDIVVRK